MVNPYRGEAELTLNQEVLPMRLSLGSLASLEASMKQDSLMGMIERFETGKFKTEDLIKLLFAGLKGAGWEGDETDLINGEIEGGPVCAARKAGHLLAVTFGMPDDQ